MGDIVLVEGQNELNVQMVPLAPPSGEILGITWWDGAAWHPITDPMPQVQTLDHRFRVRNSGTRAATFKVGVYLYNPFIGWYWSYSLPVVIQPGEGDIDWPIWTGQVPDVYETTFHLFADDIEVDSMTVTITVI